MPSSFLLQAILGIFSTTLLSAKSADKLVQCATLSSLAQAVGAEAFKQVEFPLEVYVCVHPSSINVLAERKADDAFPQSQRCRREGDRPAGARG